jgi:uncharacterized membrane protein
LPASAGATYTIFNVSNSIETIATGINNHDEIAGWYEYRVGDGIRYHAFLREPDGTITTFKVRHTTFTLAEAINDKGTIVGEYENEGPTFGGFIRKPDGRIKNLGAAIPLAINEAGDVCGYYRTSQSDNDHAFLLTSDGTLTMIEAGGYASVATAINDAGTVVGVSYEELRRRDRVHGFIRAPDGLVTIFDVPNTRYTAPQAIAADGTIVGYFGGNRQHGFMRAPDGTLTVIDAPNGKSTRPLSINVKDEIVGSDARKSNVHSFLRKVDGKTLRFDPPGGKGTSIASAINRKGDIVGGFGVIEQAYHAYLRTRP